MAKTETIHTPHKPGITQATYGIHTCTKSPQELQTDGKQKKSSNYVLFGLKGEKKKAFFGGGSEGLRGEEGWEG